MYTNATTCADMKRIHSLARAFLKSSESLPITYTIGDTKYAGIPAAFSPQTDYRILDSNMIEYTFTGKDPQTDIGITVVCTEYQDYPVIEWTVWLENLGGANTPIICDFCGMDGSLPGGHPKIVHNTGDTGDKSLYIDLCTDLTEEKHFSEHPEGGRSNDSVLPYYRVLCDDFGYTLSIGWPGQWLSEFFLEENGFRFRAKQMDTYFYLKPGEKVRSPRMTLQTFEGGLERGINTWRRWLLDHIVPKQDGKVIKPFHSLSDHGTGIEFTQSYEAQQLHLLDSLKANDLIPDNLWIDAGWYPCKGTDGIKNWNYTGALHADPEMYPRGMKPIGDKCKELGMTFLLWFEPERVTLRNTGREYPDRFLLSLKDESVVDTIPIVGFTRRLLDGMALFNLGDKEACQWLIDHIDSLIKEYGVNIYRQDFNFPPLHWWRQNDEENRIGLTENFYNQGYLRFWKELLRRNPGLWINSVASGGRRSDLETLSISAPLHQTDYGHGTHPIHQAIEVFSYTWTPFHGSVAASNDNADGEYDFDKPYIAPAEKQKFDNFMAHNAFSPHFWPGAVGTHCAALPAGAYKQTVEYAYYKKFLKIWKRAVPYTLNSDYYVLTMTDRTNQCWHAVQFHNEDKNEGIIQVIRNTQAPDETYTANLRQIDRTKTYFFESPEFERTATVRRQDLLDKGFTITLPKRTGEIWFYKVIC